MHTAEPNLNNISCYSCLGSSMNTTHRPLQETAINGMHATLETSPQRLLKISFLNVHSLLMLAIALKHCYILLVVIVSCGRAKASACHLQISLSCAVLCQIVSLQYLSRSSLHCLAGLPCRLFLSWWHVRSIGRLWGGRWALPRTTSFFSHWWLCLWLLSSPAVTVN